MCLYVLYLPGSTYICIYIYVYMAVVRNICPQKEHNIGSLFGRCIPNSLSFTRTLRTPYLACKGVGSIGIFHMRILSEFNAG